MKRILLVLMLLSLITIGQAQTAQGGTLRLALQTNPTTLNPLLGGELSASIVYQAIFAPLVVMHPETYAIEPYLAESWEADASGQVWTFHLHPEARWHDGVAVTAEDVKFTFERVLDPAQNAQSRSDLANVSAIEAIAEKTVQITLSSPDVYFPDRIALTTTLIPLPKHLLEQFETLEEAGAFNSTAPVGSGPFKLSNVLTGSRYELSANEDFFLGRPNVDTLIFSIVPDINVRVAQLLAGDLDWIDITPANIPVLEARPNVEVLSIASNRYQIFDINMAGYPELFGDTRVRQALHHALDREAIFNTVVLGRGTLADQYIPPDLAWVPTPDYEAYAYDPERALALLAEAGWTDSDGDGILDKDGQPFSFTIEIDRGEAQREQMGPILQQYFEEIGLETELALLERSVYVDHMRVGSFQTRLGVTPVPHPENFRRAYAKEGVWNWRKYDNAAMEEVLTQALLTTDRSEQGALYQQAQELMHADPPIITMYFQEQLIAINSRVKDVPLGEFKLAIPFVYQVYIEP